MKATSFLILQQGQVVLGVSGSTIYIDVCSSSNFWLLDSASEMLPPSIIHGWTSRENSFQRAPAKHPVFRGLHPRTSARLVQEIQLCASNAYLCALSSWVNGHAQLLRCTACLLPVSGYSSVNMDYREQVRPLKRNFEFIPCIVDTKIQCCESFRSCRTCCERQGL